MSASNGLAYSEEETVTFRVALKHPVLVRVGNDGRNAFSESVFFSRIQQGILTEGEGRFSTVDLLVLTRSDQLLFIVKLYFFFITKQPVLLWRLTVLSLPLQ